MNRGDLRTAAECIQQFHQMEHVEGDDYEALADAEAALRERVREIVISATEAGDDATTTCWLPLLPPLGLSDALLPAYLSHARRALQTRLPEPPSAGATRTDELLFLQRLINACAAFLQEQLPGANASLCSADGDRALLRLVHEECEAAAVASAARFSATSQLSSWLPRVQSLQLSIAGASAAAISSAGGAAAGAASSISSIASGVGAGTAVYDDQQQKDAEASAAQV